MANKFFTKVVLFILIGVFGWLGVYADGILKSSSEELGGWIIPLDIVWALFMLAVFIAGVYWIISTGYWIIREILHVFAWMMSSIIHLEIQPYESWASIHAKEEAAAAEWARTHPVSHSYNDSYGTSSSSSSNSSSSSSGTPADAAFWQRATQTSYQQAVKEELGDW